MIKKTQSKVFMIVMLSLSIIILIITSVINIVNYNQSRQESYMLIENASGMFKQMMSFPVAPPPKTDDMDKTKRILYWKTAQFYFVIVENNTIVQTVNENSDKYSDYEINKYALKVVKENKKNGSIGNLVYGIKEIRGNKIITFMDNSIANNSLKKMFILSSIIGILSMIFAYIVSRKISLWIVKPIEDTFNKQKQFISDASHELKTPLAVICANADILESEIGTNKWLNYIQKEVGSMDKLVNSLLSLARLEKESTKGELADFDISKVVLGGTMVFESVAFEKEIQIIDNIEENLKLKGNSEEIKQLLSILIDNAIKHTEKDGQVFVSLNKSKNNIVLRVKNTGEPILKGEEKKIFERFYRSDESRNRDSKRYGLGLAIAKSIVEKHHGKIRAHSNNGITTFTVIF
ncbi:sensor histidine kinase [Terrisporobacter sp.]